MNSQDLLDGTVNENFKVYLVNCLYLRFECINICCCAFMDMKIFFSCIFCIHAKAWKMGNLVQNLHIQKVILASRMCIKVQFEFEILLQIILIQDILENNVF